jgi:hypothetical protein
MHLVVPFAAAASQAGVAAQHGLRLPQLERLLARLAPTTVTTTGADSLNPPHEHVLAACRGWPLDDGHLPLAAWLARADALAAGNAGRGWGLLTPTHWQVGSEQIVLLDPAQLHLAEDESRALLHSLRSLFEPEGGGLGRSLARARRAAPGRSGCARRPRLQCGATCRRASLATPASPSPSSSRPGCAPACWQRCALLAARGVRLADELDDGLAQLLPPQTLQGAADAAGGCWPTPSQRWRLCVVADYDCDGATACAVALRGLRLLGAAAGLPLALRRARPRGARLRADAGHRRPGAAQAAGTCW